MSDLTLEADGVLAELDPVGGRLSRLRVGGRELIASVQGEWLQAGCYPMVPWVGRLGNARFTFSGTEYLLDADMGAHAIHGLGTRAGWDAAGPGTMDLSLDGLWPFGGAAQVSYSLQAGSITCRLTVTAGEREMPVALGWHPCFNRVISGREARLEFEPSYMWERGPDHLPTGRHVDPPGGPYDDCFGGVSSGATLVWHEDLVLALESATDTWVVFDELEHVICVEPQTHPPNAFNLQGGLALGAGESVELTLRVRWAHL